MFQKIAAGQTCLRGKKMNDGHGRVDHMKPRLDLVSLESLCRQRAAAAKNQMEHWLAEAEHSRKMEASGISVQSVPVQLDWCAEGRA